MSIVIYTNGSISLDGSDTGLGVSQRRDGTVVYVRERAGVGYREISMPHPRYSLAHPSPASGAAGCRQFEEDIRAVLRTEAHPE